MNEQLAKQIFEKKQITVGEEEVSGIVDLYNHVQNSKKEIQSPNNSELDIYLVPNIKDQEWKYNDKCFWHYRKYFFKNWK